MPGHEAARFREHVPQLRALLEIAERFGVGHRRVIFGAVLISMGEPQGTAVGAQHVHDAVVKQQKRRLHAGDEQVLVVAGVGDDRRTVRRSRHIFELAAALDLELRSVGRIVELRVGDRSAAVDRIEVEVGRPRIDRALGPRRHAKPRRGIKRDVVIEELPEKRDTSGRCRVIGIVDAQRWIDNQLNRPRTQLIASIEQSAFRAHFA